jgi:hypothetical protein
MRVAPSEVLQLAVRAEAARQPNLARELYTLAGRMDREPNTDGMEPFPGEECDYGDDAHVPDVDAVNAAWSRGFMMAVRLGLDPESIAVAEAAGRVS